jgi:putative NADH-flavin reductase
MNLIIFGASGATGKELVKQALQQGHRVSAFVRTPAKLAVTHANLRLIAGDVLDSSAVAAAIPGHDAVLISLGAPARKAGTMRSEGTRNIVRAVEAAGVRRLVCQSSLGFGDSLPVLRQTPFVFRNIIVPLLLRDTFEDHARQEDVVKNTSLDWTIVRPGNMTNKPATHRYRHGFAAEDTSIKVKVSRADVAHFMLRHAASKDYLGQTPGISD